MQEVKNISGAKRDIYLEEVVWWAGWVEYAMLA